LIVNEINLFSIFRLNKKSCPIFATNSKEVANIHKGRGIREGALSFFNGKTNIDNWLYLCMSFFARLFNDPFKPSKGKWLFIGDSQTNSMATNYVNELRKLVGFTNYRIIQKNGATTDWMLTEFNKLWAKDKSWDFVVVWGGYNDMYGVLPPAKARVRALENLTKISDTARFGSGLRNVGSLGIPRRVIIVDLHCDAYRDNSVRDKVIESETNILYRDILTKIPSANYVVPTRSITGGCPSSDALLKTNRTTFCTRNDKLCHLNATGNRAIAMNIYNNFLRY